MLIHLKNFAKVRLNLKKFTYIQNFGKMLLYTHTHTHTHTHARARARARAYNIYMYITTENIINNISNHSKTNNIDRNYSHTKDDRETKTIRYISDGN